MNWTKFLVLGYYDGKTVKYFFKIKEFLHFLFQKENHIPSDIFAHFGGRFDFLFIIEAILKEDPADKKYKIENMVPMGSGLLCFTLRRNKRKITFRDSSALLPFGLKKITESFGCASKKKEWDHEKTKGVTPELLEYLKYDLLGLHESLCRYYSTSFIKRGGPASTQASQALRILRCFIERPIHGLSPSLDAEIRDGYFGGRTEIFKPFYKGARPLYCFDVNSLYPHVMGNSGHEYPNSFEYETLRYEKQKLGIYWAQVHVPGMYIPPLGILHRNKYVFPVGSYRGIFTSAEIEYGRILGCTFKIEKGWVFSNGGELFSGFIQEMYRVRMEAKDAVASTVAKLLMNSCYGRFALNRSRENLIFDDGRSGLVPFRDLKVGKKNYRLMTEDVELNSFSNVAIGCFVTAYARIYMHKLMMKAGKNGSAMYYTDTDSMYTTHEFETGAGLGALKLEDTVHSACFLLPKTYMAGSKIVMKGFDKKKTRDFTMEDFLSCLEGDLRINNLKIQNEPKFATLKTALKKGFVVGMTPASTRQIRSRYDKRVIVNGNGIYDSQPIHLEG